jgi:E1A/CREB-binding protein
MKTAPNSQQQPNSNSGVQPAMNTTFHNVGNVNINNINIMVQPNNPNNSNTQPQQQNRYIYNNQGQSIGTVQQQNTVVSTANNNSTNLMLNQTSNSSSPSSSTSSSSSNNISSTIAGVVAGSANSSSNNQSPLNATNMGIIGVNNPNQMRQINRNQVIINSNQQMINSNNTNSTVNSNTIIQQRPPSQSSPLVIQQHQHQITDINLQQVDQVTMLNNQQHNRFQQQQQQQQQQQPHQPGTQMIHLNSTNATLNQQIIINGQPQQQINNQYRTNQMQIQQQSQQQMRQPTTLNSNLIQQQQQQQQPISNQPTNSIVNNNINTNTSLQANLNNSSPVINNTNTTAITQQVQSTVSSMNSTNSAPAVVTSSSTTTTTTTTNATNNANNLGTVNEQEKRKLIQQQLVLLLHAHKCSQRTDRNCHVPHCMTMRNVLAHMTQCTEGRNCTVAHCASSRQIIAHWKNCNKADCPVCNPLRTTNQSQNNTNIQRPGQPAVPQASSQPQSSSVNVSTSGGIPNNSPNRTGYSTQSVSQDIQSSIISDQFNPTSQSSALKTHLTPPHQSQPSLVLLNQQPQQPQVHKAWHENITSEMRKHLVQKIIQTIFPTQDHNIYKDPRLANLVGYAVKTECEMYEQAKDQEEYFHLLAERIYKIQKEFEDKQRSRNRNLSSSSLSSSSSVTASSTNSNEIVGVLATSNSGLTTNDPHTFHIQLNQLNNDSLPPPNKPAPADSKKTSFNVLPNSQSFNNQQSAGNQSSKLPLQTLKDFDISNPNITSTNNHFHTLNNNNNNNNNMVNSQQSNDSGFPRSNNLLNINNNISNNNNNSTSTLLSDISIGDNYVKEETLLSSNDINQEIKKEKVEPKIITVKTETVINFMLDLLRFIHIPNFI